ncbi:MAG: MYG1 family protein [Simkaniaceae bacterium]
MNVTLKFEHLFGMEMHSPIKKNSFGTHDGSFHADEVTACALLLLFNLIDKDKIIRTRDQAKLNACEYVCDVGGVYDPDKKRFDHHQVDYDGPLSSAGMVLLYLKESRFIEAKLYEYFNQSLVIGIDAVDNGQEKPKIGHCSFSGVIANFVPVIYDLPKKAMDEAFFKALAFVTDHLKRLKERFYYIQNCREDVKKAMEEGNLYLLFDRAMPWIDSFFELGGEEHPALFVIMPSGPHWKLRGIPPTYDDRMNVRLHLPKSWAGLLEEDLKKASGIEGAIFCHKGRFISIWETKEDALRALESILEERNVP